MGFSEHPDNGFKDEDIVKSDMTPVEVAALELLGRCRAIEEELKVANESIKQLDKRLLKLEHE